MFDNFEELLKEYEPMIYHLLSKYHVRDQDKEFYQELAITLWEASLKYEEGKTKFSTFAYSKMHYRLIDLFRKNNRIRKQEEAVCKENKQNAVFFEAEYDRDHLFIQQIKDVLTAREWLWFKGQIFEGKTLVEIAHEQDLKANAVRHWKRKAVLKIRKLWEQETN